MKIDVIIPAYNAHETIKRTLHSIALQSIVSDVRVTIVDDCSKKGYKDIVKLFSDEIDIQEIRMSKNGGPGVARQYGIDNTDNPLLTFIDADDTFANAFSLEILRKNLLEDPQYHTCIGTFVEVNNGRYLPHQQDMVWMFGKMYRRDFLKRYNIHFNETRANEDNGFNTMVRLCSSETEKVKFIQDIVYFWHENPNSITRINNCQYSYDQSFVGYTDNMIYAIEEGRKRKPYNGYITMWAVQCMVQLYEYYMESVVRDPRFNEQNWKCCVKYYKRIYKDIEPNISKEQLAEHYNDVMRNAYAGNKMFRIIPALSIYEFLENLKKDAEGMSDEDLKVNTISAPPVDLIKEEDKK